MATYLLTWNPSHWTWTDLPKHINEIRKQGFHLDTWSCGVTKKIEPGDRIFLMKLGGEKPRGIVASGWATSHFFENKHWNKKQASIGKTALYIKVHFDTILNSQKLILPKQITINSYERSAEARSICIKHHGLSCAVCDFNFGKFYGQIGQNFIHVHHLRPLSEVKNDYELNPITDLKPVCPNCHAMLHKRKPAYTIQELKTIMKQVSR